MTAQKINPCFIGVSRHKDHAHNDANGADEMPHGGACTRGGLAMAVDWSRLVRDLEVPASPAKNAGDKDPSDLVLVEYHAPVQRGSNGR